MLPLYISVFTLYFNDLVPSPNINVGVPPGERTLEYLILAGCHVRASAGDLAVHGALIPCVCVCVCVCVSGHKLLSHHATNRDQVSFRRQVSTRKVDNCHGFFSLLCLGRAATVQTYHPTTKRSIFSFLSPVFGEHPPNHAED